MTARRLSVTACPSVVACEPCTPAWAASFRSVPVVARPIRPNNSGGFSDRAASRRRPVAGRSCSFVMGFSGRRSRPERGLVWPTLRDGDRRPGRAQQTVELGGALTATGSSNRIQNGRWAEQRSGQDKCRGRPERRRHAHERGRGARARARAGGCGARESAGIVERRSIPSATGGYPSAEQRPRDVAAELDPRPARSALSPGGLDRQAQRRSVVPRRVQRPGHAPCSTSGPAGAPAR